MPGFFNSTRGTVIYKNRKDTIQEEQDAEILISSSEQENWCSEEVKQRSFPQLKACLHPYSIVIILLIFFVTLGTLYCYTSILQDSLSGSCVSLQRVEKVIIVTERTGFEQCSDSKSCHSFLDVIEEKHDGLKYNFVIGQRGELYIGAGFKCLVNSDENTFYVKILESEKLASFDEYLKMCFRLTEIIDHGISCGKFSPNYTIQDRGEICTILESGKNRSYHVHDPGHEMKLIHEDFGWTVCGGFSTTMNLNKNKVVTLESLPKKSCPPLQLVDEITVDINETLPLSCSDLSSCMREYEKHHEGFKYNFIIGHNQDVYVGLGFKCKAGSTSGNSLKILVLREPGYLKQMRTLEKQVESIILELDMFYQILKEGFACGRISYKFFVNCNIFHKQQEVFIGGCGYYQMYDTIDDIEIMTPNMDGLFLDFNATTDTENCTHIVPGLFRYDKFILTKQDTTTLLSVPPSSIDTMTENPIVTNKTSCISFKKVYSVNLTTEETDYFCSNNMTCPSLLDTIERKHNGLKYNFVIGPKGELYIGAGFKCLINSEDSETLYVKLLKNRMSSEEEHFAVCSRLSEIIKHGILCEKISQYHYAYHHIPYDGFNIPKNCYRPEEGYKNRSHHLHDPEHRLRTLIPENFKWTICGDFLNRTDMGEDRTITLESLPANYCSPLKLVNQITVDVVETSPFNCSDDSSCLQKFEEHHDGLNYNFIIGHQHDVYVGLGFNCKAQNTFDNIFKIKVLIQPEIRIVEWKLQEELIKLLQIINEGIACGKVSKGFSVKTNCNIADNYLKYLCEYHYQYIPNQIDKDFLSVTQYEDKYYNISSGYVRQIVPQTVRYRFCHSEHSSDTFTSLPDSLTEELSTTSAEIHTSESYQDQTEEPDWYYDYK